jgi:hypothetical protein
MPAIPYAGRRPRLLKNVVGAGLVPARMHGARQYGRGQASPLPAKFQFFNNLGLRPFIPASQDPSARLLPR